jgi:hypothetical protein
MSKRTAAATPPETPPSAPTAPTAHVIKPTAIYSKDGARRALGLAVHTLAREIRKGRLRAVQRGGKVFIIGEDLLAWLRGGELLRPWKPKGEGPDAPTADQAAAGGEETQRHEGEAGR